MAVTINSGTQVLREGTWQSVDALTESTATAEQSISRTSPVTTLSGGTATGFGVNKYALAAGQDGDMKLIYQLATGESKVRFGAATTNLMATGLQYYGADTAGVATATGVASAFSGAATGAFVLSAKGHYLRCQYMDGAWWVIGGNATIATAT